MATKVLGASMKFSLILPSRDRVLLLNKLLSSIEQNTDDLSSIEVLIAVDGDDFTTKRYLASSNWGFVKSFVVPRSPDLNFSRDYRNFLMTKASGEWFVILDDDCACETRGWDTIAYEILKDKPSVIYGRTEDGMGEYRAHGHGDYCCFPILGRGGVEASGWIFPGRLPNWGADLHIRSLYLQVGSCVDIPIMFRHYSHHNATRDQDALNKRIQDNQVHFDMRPTYEEVNTLLFALKREQGLPLPPSPVVKVEEPPLVSFIGPGHRTEMWKRFSDGLVTNLSYEIIFVTDKYPTKQELEGCKNLRWIYSKVKPAQCFEIAYREARGKFIVWTGDDFEYPNYGLDRVYEMYTRLNDYKKMVSFAITQDLDPVEHYLLWDPSVMMTTTGLISKQAIEEAGGLADINFVCGHWDIDLIMRIRALGGDMVKCTTAKAIEAHKECHKKEYNFGTTHAAEWRYFEMLWSEKEKTTPRKLPFSGYQNENLLFKNQGYAGKWKEKEDEPTVSIILPTIRPQLFNTVLNSIKQGYSGVPEVVVVADYPQKLDLETNFKWIVEPRQGPIHAINTAYAYATGEYIFLNSDDAVLDPGCIDELIKFSKAHGDKVLIGPLVNNHSLYRYWGKFFAAWTFCHRSVIEKINKGEKYFFDPKYHSFYADPDLSMRAWDMGIEVLQCPTAHLEVKFPTDTTFNHLGEASKQRVYRKDQGIFVNRFRRWGKFLESDSEIDNIRNLI